MVIAIVLIAEATPVVLANIQAFVYYVKTFGVVQGIQMYRYLGVQNLPDGVISWLQMDMADGDSSLDDIDFNKLHHIFGKTEHKLEEFLTLYEGNQVNAYRALLNATQEYVKTNGIIGMFEKVINVNGYDITVRGTVVNGIVKIGTAFIK